MPSFKKILCPVIGVLLTLTMTVRLLAYPISQLSKEAEVVELLNIPCNQGECPDEPADDNAPVEKSGEKEDKNEKETEEDKIVKGARMIADKDILLLGKNFFSTTDNHLKSYSKSIPTPPPEFRTII